VSRAALLLLTVSAWLALSAGCSRETESATKPSAAPTNAIAAAEPATDEFQTMLLREGGPAGYVGSAACKACHEDQFGSWHRTYHRTMTQFASPATVQANFDNQTLTNNGIRFLLSKQDEELRVRMERIDPAGSSDAPPAAMDTRVSLVTGSHHMQVFWVPGGDGNTQIGFPFTWLIPEARWVPRNTTFIRPPGFQHQSEIWNVTCSRCHSTAIEPRVDTARHVMDSRAAELGISCEACHGPGERHVAARKSAGPGAAKPDLATLRQEIIQPERLDAKRSSEICGFCHSMKWMDRGEPWRGSGFRYRPGDDLEATTPLIQPAKAASTPGLKEYLAKNPAVLDDFFWSDGMGRVSGREYNSVAQSPCFQGGKFSCLSCHSLHESEPNDLLAKNRTGNEACLQCHAKFKEPAQLRQHTHHLAESSGSECYNCHMPHTTYGVLSAIRSHQISNPRVADQLATGRPNACNLCHLEKSLEWTANQLAAWFRHPVPELSPPQRDWAESVRLGLAGDAGQRALIAWHWGWQPALKASAKGWLAPMLGALLDDPYAAIRCQAERSLRKSGLPVPNGYDFVPEPDSRPPVSNGLLDRWRTHLATNGTVAGSLPSTVVVQSTGGSLEEQLAPVLRLRDHRPMRLRE
jgi:predicted CXXCH cytochrome family protein